MPSLNENWIIERKSENYNKQSHRIQKLILKQLNTVSKIYLPNISMLDMKKKSLSWWVKKFSEWKLCFHKIFLNLYLPYAPDYNPWFEMGSFWNKQVLVLFENELLNYLVKIEGHKNIGMPYKNIFTPLCLCFLPGGRCRSLAQKMK